MLNYLSKLEEVAKLEPCGIHYVARTRQPGHAEISHVVARTTGAHRKYYYRRREYGSWTPWEQIKLDIEDNPVIPVVWNDRLLLLWLQIIREVPIAGPDTTVLGPTGSDGQEKPIAQVSIGEMKANASTSVNVRPPVAEVRAILCWSEYRDGKWQEQRTSDVNRPADLGNYPVGGFDRSRLWLAVGEATHYLRSKSRMGSFWAARPGFTFTTPTVLPSAGTKTLRYLVFRSSRSAGLRIRLSRFTTGTRSPTRNCRAKSSARQ